MTDILKCAFCSHSGRVKTGPASAGLCPVCNGEGEREIPANYDVKDCLLCNGSGSLKSGSRSRKPCIKCEGWGSRLFKKSVLSGIKALMFEDGKAYDNYMDIKGILEPLDGAISVCDPYLKDETLSTLKILNSSQKIRVLSYRDQTSPGALANFKKQFALFEFRRAPNVLHDRYILTAASLILLGRGLSDLGRGDSFVVELTEEFAEDLIKSCQSTFEHRWANANPV